MKALNLAKSIDLFQRHNQNIRSFAKPCWIRHFEWNGFESKGSISKAGQISAKCVHFLGLEWTFSIGRIENS